MAASESNFVRKPFHKEIYFILIGNNSYPLSPGGNKTNLQLLATVLFKGERKKFPNNF